MYRPLSQQIPFVFSALAERGISLHPSSRLRQLAQAFRAEDGSYTETVPFNDSERFELALEALREFQLFEYILDPWSFGIEAVPSEKLHTAATKDQALQYAQAKGETKGRDTQVELFIASAFRRAGAGAEILLPTHGVKSPDIRTRACNP